MVGWAAEWVVIWGEEEEEGCDEWKDDPVIIWKHL